ncbi:MAG: 5-formyltetrahydrofolate cyclo-ligase [Verrucomicrobiae bacterium]|nr:5-formyltetrahydrofolate cyclo-ligase [Verrucomicrobiae bacterium]MDW8309186.1 5-formyltetrahydrofolate cyclo-ligase [Verrucomicrobiales bacterium]
MLPTIATLKSALRHEVRRRLENLTPEQRDVASRRLCARLQQQPVWLNARAVLGFAPTAGEPDIWPLLQAALAEGRTVALPRFAPDRDAYEAAVVRDLSRDLVVARFGIREPSCACRTLAVSEVDLILVPGVAFDLRGHRLGRGKGYYDRLLTGARAVKCAVAFEEQIVEAVPVEPQDVRVDCIVTAERWVQIAVA